MYESPDKGHTVYRRLIGQSPTERELYSISQEKRNLDHRLEREMKWNRIVHAGDHDPVLREMLDQIEIYYHLKSQP